MLVLTWNLFHGRSVPDAPREQLGDFAARLAGWEWDVAAAAGGAAVVAARARAARAGPARAPP